MMMVHTKYVIQIILQIVLHIGVVIVLIAKVSHKESRMSRPTPDGREWLTAEELATRGYRRIRGKYQHEEWWDDGRKEEIIQCIAEGFRSAEYDIEFKLVRLFERFRKAIVEGQIKVSPLVRAIVVECFYKEFLDSLDDNAMPKEEE
jgi:hypothetical protein